jgi:hypothetical protein
MKKGDALPGKYLSKDDFPAATLVTIKMVTLEMVKSDRGPDECKPVAYFREASNTGLDLARGVILNVGNWEACEEITGEDDSDNWMNKQVVVYVDPDVTFGGKRVGGIRIRASNVPVPAQEPPPPKPSDDVPF